MRERRGGTVPKVRPDRCHEQGSEHDGREDRRPDAGLRPRDRFDRRDSHADHVLLTSRASMYSGTRTIYGRRDLPMCDLRPTSENVVSSISNPGVTVPSGGMQGTLRGGPWARRTRRRHAPGAFDKSERPTPIAMPWRRPIRTAPTVVEIAITKSNRWVRQSSRRELTSIRRRTAPITTAARAVVGRFSSGSVKNSRTASIPSAAVTLASCERPPTISTTAVRAALALVVIPPDSPEARFAEPSPSRSRFASTSYPLRCAKALELTIVSAAARRAIAAENWMSATTSAISKAGRPIGGRPAGSDPTSSTSEKSPPANPTATAAATITS